MNSYQKVRHFVTIQDSDGLKQLLHAQLASTDKKEMFTDIFLAYPACLSLLWHAILGVPHATLSVALLQRKIHGARLYLLAGPILGSYRVVYGVIKSYRYV